MKKIIAVWMCLILGVACFTGCANNGETFEQKSHIADVEEITEVFIDVRDRKIEVAPSSDGQIHIDYFESAKEYYDLSVSDDHTLTMTAKNNKEWTDYIGGKPTADFRKIPLQIPDKLLKTLKLSTTNEDIILPELTVAGDISLSSQGGNVVLNKLNAKNTISLTAKNGDIIGSIVGSYDEYAISCDIKKGESNLPSIKESGTKTLTVSNNNGNIDIEFTAHKKTAC